MFIVVLFFFLEFTQISNWIIASIVFDGVGLLLTILLLACRIRPVQMVANQIAILLCCKYTEWIVFLWFYDIRGFILKYHEYQGQS